jgi:hypothetical protein
MDLLGVEMRDLINSDMNVTSIEVNFQGLYGGDAQAGKELKAKEPEDITLQHANMLETINETNQIEKELFDHSFT